VAGNASAIEHLSSQLAQLNKTTARGVVVNVWWGLVEQTPQEYNWSIYVDLFEAIAKSRLKIKVSLNFHQCNISGVCFIPLPDWVQEVGKKDSDIYYTDPYGNRNTEYLSSGVDYQPVFPPGRRTAVEMYIDFIQSFAFNFFNLFDTVIYEVKVGLGPAGQLKYPAFPANMWQYPGAGEFQCYDKYLTQEYNVTAVKVNHPEWANLPPGHTLPYNGIPKNIPFFSNGTNNYDSDYGQYFLGWYSYRLIQHGQSVLSNAISILNIFSPNISVTAALECVHWQYQDPSHAAELTAGYKNDAGDGYIMIVQMLKNLGVVLEFPCFDLSDGAQPSLAKSSPVELVLQTLAAAELEGVDYEGRNSEPSFDSKTFSQMEQPIKTNHKPIIGFDLFTLSDALFEATTFESFKSFLKDLSNPGKM